MFLMWFFNLETEIETSLTSIITRISNGDKWGTIFRRGVFPVTRLKSIGNSLAPVVQTLDSAIHWINLYPADSVIDFCNTYPLDSDLSGG